MKVRLAAAVMFSGILAALPAAAQDRHVKIVNNTGYTMTQFYGSNKGSKSWEEDILGSDTLPSGYSVTIDFDDGSGYCIFDFKAVFEDGDEVTQPQVNVCDLGTFTFN